MAAGVGNLVVRDDLALRVDQVADTQGEVGELVVGIPDGVVELTDLLGRVR